MASQSHEQNNPPNLSAPKNVSRVQSTSSKTPRTNKSSAAQPGTLPKPSLSCELCRSRKIKCDKAEGGCSNCRRAGVKCVAINRQRLPRGRNGGRKPADVELKARIAKLENMIATLESEKEPKEKDVRRSDPSESTHPGSTSRQASPDDSAFEAHTSGHLEAFGRYMSPNFWHSLSTEINGLRDVLQEDIDGDSEHITETIPSPESTDASFVFGSRALDARLEPLQRPPRVMMIGLTEIYLQNVDAPFKILHAPTLRAYMREENTYLSYAPGSSAVEALSFGVFLAAVTSLSDQDCYAAFGIPRTTLYQTYRSCLERTLALADFITTRDVTVLQAFLLYLKCVRCQSPDRFAWTLLAMAVRIAHDMNLHHDDIYSRSPFETEMRRRLWAHIVIADTQSARDRGSVPLIAANGYTTPLPLNINDTDLDFDSREPIQEHDGITDTSLLLTEQLGCHTLKQLAFLSNSSLRDPSTEIDIDWEKRLQFAHAFRRQINERFLQHCDYNLSLHCALRDISEVMARNLLVYVFRPLERHPRSTPPPVTGEQLLNIAGAALESFEVALTNPTCKQFRWFGQSSNQWHTLAVMVAELCVYPLGPAADQAWSMLEPMMLLSRSNIAEGQSGMLWRPLEKMVRRAREVRENALSLNAIPRGEGSTSMWHRQGGAWSAADANAPVFNFDNLRVSPMQSGANSHVSNFAQPHVAQGAIYGTSRSWSVGNEGMSGNHNLGESPEVGFAAWESFLVGLQRSETPVAEVAYYSSTVFDRRSTS